jgi:hypothetical protein
MKEVEAIKKVKQFFSNFSDVEFLDFSNPHKLYYIYTDVQRRGCFESHGYFATKSETNEFIENLFTHGAELDRICIFDVKHNVEVKPKI